MDNENTEAAAPPNRNGRDPDTSRVENLLADRIISSFETGNILSDQNLARLQEQVRISSARAVDAETELARVRNEHFQELTRIRQEQLETITRLREENAELRLEKTSQKLELEGEIRALKQESDFKERYNPNISGFDKVVSTAERILPQVMDRIATGPPRVETPTIAESTTPPAQSAVEPAPAQPVAEPEPSPHDLLVKYLEDMTTYTNHVLSGASDATTVGAYLAAEYQKLPQKPGSEFWAAALTNVSIFARETGATHEQVAAALAPSLDAVSGARAILTLAPPKATAELILGAETDPEIVKFVTEVIRAAKRIK